VARVNKSKMNVLSHMLTASTEFNKKYYFAIRLSFRFETCNAGKDLHFGLLASDTV